MTKLLINDKEYEVKDNKKTLIRFLRDDLGLVSVKDGCSQGACGTCHVLIDGKSVKCCMRKVSAFEGKKIYTVDGLPKNVQDAFSYAFAKCGAVQCGFCIPGMVISGYALILNNPNPTRDEAKFAIRNNICRCTGYKKIVDGILLAAQILRENKEVSSKFFKNYRIGNSVPRTDAIKKVLGTAKYPDDIHFDDMLYASALRSKYPRAKLLSIDASEALEMDGIEAVLTAEDIPGQLKSGHLKQDWNCMIPIRGYIHFLGDAICLVVGVNPDVVEAAKDKIKVEYKELSFVDSTKEAMKEGAPLVHKSGNLCERRHIRRGHARIAINKSPHIYKAHFETPHTEHAFLEPECCVAVPDGDGVLIFSSDQGTYDTQREVATILGIQEERVKVYNANVGGGFGGKEDVIIQHHAALAALLLKKPVKVKLSRAESLLIHPKRHPFSMDFILGMDDDGIIQGVKAHVIADTGAYASLCGPVLERACTHAAGPYNYQDFEIRGEAYYTNNPPSGAFRGFGVTQTNFAIESLLNKAADDLGISAWEIRYRNAIRPGQELPNGQIVDEATGLVETLEAVKPIYDKNPGAGIACAMKNSGVGVGLPDYGRIILSINNNKVQIKCGASCMGQGIGTVLIQIVCTMLDCKKSDVILMPPNTQFSPDSGTTSGSRQTTISGEACRLACEKILKECRGKDWNQLNGRDFYAEYYAKTDPIGAGVANPVSHIAYGYATQLCILDKETKKVSDIYAAHDVGYAINPMSVEGQIEGGVLTGAGFALTEKYPLKDCKPIDKFGKLGLFKANNSPEIHSIIVEKDGLNTSFGAKGIGEITSIPTAAAISNAYFNDDGIFRDSLPLKDTPYSK